MLELITEVTILLRPTGSSILCSGDMATPTGKHGYDTLLDLMPRGQRLTQGGSPGFARPSSGIPLSSHSDELVASAFLLGSLPNHISQS